MESHEAAPKNALDRLRDDPHILNITNAEGLTAGEYCMTDAVPERIKFDFDIFLDTAVRYISDPIIEDDFELQPDSYEQRKLWKAGLSEELWQELNRNILRLNRVLSVTRSIKQFFPSGDIGRHLPEGIKLEFENLESAQIEGYGALSIDEKLLIVRSLQNTLKYIINTLIEYGLLEGAKLQ